MATKARLKKIENVAAARQAGLILVLEKIHDPHNLAAILRSADAFGAQKVWIVFEEEHKFNPRRVGKVSSSSANKWLDFQIFPSTAACVRELKKKKYKIAVTLLDERAKSLARADLSAKNLALVVGNEHRGVSEEMAAAADVKIYIPMCGFVQSLNVSVTAALILYAAAQQRRAPKYLLSGSAKQRLLSDFLQR